MVRTTGSPDSLLFDDSDGRPLLYSGVLSCVKRCAQQEGLDPSLYGTHSLRAGCASALIASGIPPAVVQKFGRWASADSMDTYIVPSDKLFKGISDVLATGVELHFLSRL